MATSNTSPPFIAKISMIGIWIESVLYGINCIMYGLCMFILLRGGKVATMRWMLIVTSTVLFLLCTVHVGVSLRQLLEAFVYTPANIPNYSATYWLDFTAKPVLIKDNVYGTLLFVQEIVLIWRVYVVFMYNWRVIIFPIILAACCVGSIYAASGVSVPADGVSHGSITSSLVVSAWTFGFILNVSVTAAIAGRLWWMNRTMAPVMNIPTNRYASSIYFVVESGAISAVAGTVVVALFASNSPASLSSLDVVSQLAGLMPLLIVVQVGLTGQARIPVGGASRTALTALEEITFREGIPRRQGSLQEISPHATLSHSQSIVHGSTQI